jgi:ribonucleoside-diphosphate reductase alpha chain
VNFLNDAAEFVFYRTYSRWRDDLARRETYQETVDRVLDFFQSERGDVVPPKVLKKIKQYMMSLSVLPSMRLVWSAGEAARKTNVAMYNCSFINVDCIEAFSESLYILCCGTGVGFSVSGKHIEKLPVVPIAKYDARVNTHVIPDNKEGWADSIKHLLTDLYKGEKSSFDYSQIRKKGERLKTMGGRASGPEPLIICHAFINEIFNKAQGRKLTSLECHDIMNKIGEIVVSGGVRRSAEISLSDLDDTEMRDAKVWPFPDHRIMSNNSAIYETKPDGISFLKEWSSLAASGTGERGIFNLEAARKNAPKRRKAELIEGVNPCAEISLRNLEFCNLSTVIVRPEDDLDSLLEKVECATWIGTIQASFTDFPYLRPEWKKNCEEERLLGVSLCGHMDNPSVLTPDAWLALKARAIKVNKKASKILGIAEASAITCGKPDGTSSQLVTAASGCHPWYSQFLIRRYRIASTDPLFHMMRAQGIVFSPENGQTAENATTWVVAFPIRAPEGSVVKDDVSALDQLEWYKKVQQNWCEHNQSITVYVKENEWLEVGNWVYKNWDIINGISFLPFDGGKYEQAPLEAITEKEYNKMLNNFKKIDYSKLGEFELDDSTEGAKSYACVSGSCEI